MSRRKPSRRAIDASLRYYAGMRIDGEPPGAEHGEAAGSEPETTPGTTGERQHTTLDPDEKMRRGKLALTHAAALALANDPDAERSAEDALRLLDEARAELALRGERGQ